MSEDTNKEKKIAQIAYSIYEKRIQLSLEGDEISDWLNAEKQFSKNSSKNKLKSHSIQKKKNKLCDLTLIKGIGKVYSKRLNNAGIYSLKDIANASTEKIINIGKIVKSDGRPQREKWTVQAKNILKNK